LWSSTSEFNLDALLNDLFHLQIFANGVFVKKLPVFPAQPINPVLMQKFSKISVKYRYFSHR
jgi:hypothetical protein